MNFTQPLPSDAPHICSRLDEEKCSQHCNNYGPNSLDDDTPYGHHLHGNCHRRRLRRVLVPVLLGLLAAFLLLCVMIAACRVYFPEAGAGEDGWLVMLGDSVKYMKRATDGTTGNSNTFVSNKLYLIVIFVGLVVVVIFGIMLSAWCCRGSFENPLCCPCYLCACCGGLACLECIGCGLCAAGVEQM